MRRLTQDSVRGVLLLCLAACTNSTGPGRTTYPDPANGPIVYMHRATNMTVWRIAPNGSDARNLATGSGDEDFPALSADRRSIAWISYSSTPAGIWVMDTAGNNRRFIYNTSGTRLSWSPDGSQLALGETELDPVGIWLFSSTTNDTPSVLNENQNWVAAGPAWSPDGQRFAFWTNLEDTSGYTTNIYQENIDGSNVVPIYRPAGDSGAQDPAWSPDGRSIAFAVGNLSYFMRLYIANADGSNPRPITEPTPCGNKTIQNNDLSPAWSRDGQWIAFQRTYALCVNGQPGPSNSTDIFVVRADGTHLMQVTHDGLSLRPTW